MSTEQAQTPREPARQSILWALISTALVAAWLAWVGGWMWALGGVVGLLVHEFGHYLAINKAGLGPSRIYLVPFVGGLATQPKASPDEMTDIVIALAGPALGVTASLPFFGLAFLTGNPEWLIGAFFIGVINLFNLVPAPPLDGSKALGPVLARIHPMVERAVVVILAGLAIIWLASRGSFIVAALIALAVAPVIMGRPMRGPSDPLTGPETVRALALYVGVLCLCLGVIYAVGVVGGLSNPFQLLGALL